MDPTLSRRDGALLARLETARATNSAYGAASAERSRLDTSNAKPSALPPLPAASPAAAEAWVAQVVGENTVAAFSYSD